MSFLFHDDISAHDQISMCLDHCLYCATRSQWFKFVLYAHQAAQLLLQLHKPDQALIIEKLAAIVYGLNITDQLQQLQTLYGLRLLHSIVITPLAEASKSKRDSTNSTATAQTLPVVKLKHTQLTSPPLMSDLSFNYHAVLSSPRHQAKRRSFTISTERRLNRLQMRERGVMSSRDDRAEMRFLHVEAELLNTLLTASQSDSTDSALTVRCVALLLRRVHTLLSAEQQQDLLQRFKQAASKQSSAVLPDTCCFVEVLKAEWIELESLQCNQDDNDVVQPFIYQPTLETRRHLHTQQPSTLQLPQSQTVKCRLTIRNPLTVAVELQACQLIGDVESIQLAATPQPIELPACASHVVDIEATALKCGVFQLMSCELQLQQFKWQCEIESNQAKKLHLIFIDTG